MLSDNTVSLVFPENVRKFVAITVNVVRKDYCTNIVRMRLPGKKRTAKRGKNATKRWGE
jgi:hypothetical protein